MPRAIFDFIEVVALKMSNGLYDAIAGGVRGAIDILRDEIDRVLAQIGCPSVNELNEDFVHPDCGRMVVKRHAKQRI